MRTLKEALISKDKRNWVSAHKKNKYGITGEDLIEDIAGFPLGVVVKMMEEQEKQGNKPDVTIFQDRATSDGETYGGFDWESTKDGRDFWENVIREQDFNQFFKKYPQYKVYNI